MADKARLLAARALLRVSSGGFSNIVLDSMLEEAKLDQRDRAFASALFYGVLERRITIDILIKKYSSTPPEKLDPEAAEVLRMGFYQILYMNSVPDNAAVNESVELIKALGFPKASGFVAGLLSAFPRSIPLRFGSVKSGALNLGRKERRKPFVPVSALRRFMQG